MSTFKKLLALTLALAMVLSVSAFAGYSADTYADAADIDEDCEAAVELLYALDIMKGDGKNFNPEATVTRAEMAKMIYVVLNYGNDDKAVTYTGAKMFADVQAGAWYEGYVNYAAATKLVQGRPDGTFGPMDPVTTAEAAKMMLTAIGYSAEARGYIGANWDKNVLSDASIIGLLNGYKSNVNTYAPRQWVAVMMANCLDAKTYKTMAPSFSGLLTSGEETDGILSMGAKYYDYVVYTGYLVAANGYQIDTIGSDLTLSKIDNGEIVIQYTKSGSYKYVCLEADATLEDLGQQFKVITVDGDVVSMRNTGKSVVGEDEIKDVSYELTYSTSDNKANNRYEFTVGELTGKLNVPDKKAEANLLKVVAGADKYTTKNSAALQGYVDDADTRNDVVRAIDRDGDGDIDYVIYVPVNYAYITKTGTSQKYGDYVKAVGTNGADLKINNGSNLYLDDVVYSEDDLAKGNVVKFTWDIDEEMYRLEVLELQETVEFESRKSNKNQFTFGGETYKVAANAFDDVTDDDDYYGNVKAILTGSGALDKDFDIVVDGELLVYVAKTDDNYTSMDDVNANLAVLIKADVRNTDDENDKQVKLLTIDGEIAWYAYNISGAKKADNGQYKTDDDGEFILDAGQKVFKDAKQTKDVILTWADVKGDDNDENGVWDQLVIVHTNDDGEVYLELLEDSRDLNMETKLVDDVQFITKKTLEVDEGKGAFEGMRIGEDYKFFAYVEDEYTVITMSDLEDGKYAKVSAKAALINDGTYYDSIVGGYLVIGDSIVSEDGFLFVTSLTGLEEEEGKTTISVLLDDGTEKDIRLSATSEIPTETKVCYYYTFDGSKYTLKDNWKGGWTELTAEAGDELWYKNAEGKWTTIDLGDFEIFGVKTIENLMDMPDDKRPITSTSVEFMSVEDLIAKIDANIDMLDNDDYTYSFDYSFYTDETSTGSNGDDILYLKIVMNMIENNENKGDLE